MSYRAIVFCDPECLLSFDTYLKEHGLPSMPVKTAVTMTDANELFDDADPKFTIPEWDYLAERYKMVLVEPVDGKEYFKKAICGFFCTPDGTAPNVGHGVQQAMALAHCPAQEVLKVYKDNDNLTLLRGAWRL